MVWLQSTRDDVVPRRRPTDTPNLRWHAEVGRRIGPRQRFQGTEKTSVLFPAKHLPMDKKNGDPVTLHTSVLIFKADDVVFPQIASGLDFDQMKGDLTRIF